MNGLGMWLTVKDRAILKARRKKPSSQGKSVADCYDQTSHVEFVRSEDPAMINAVETPSAITPSGACEVTQWTEAGSHRRNDVPVKKGKARDTLNNLGSSDAGDSSREKGKTQEFLTVHSQL